MPHRGKIKLQDDSDLVYTNDESSFNVGSVDSSNIKLVVGLSHPAYYEISKDHNYIGLAGWVEEETKRLLAVDPGIQNYNTIYNFTFNINKKQINRYMLLKLVEWFELDNYTYTWSGIGESLDMSDMIADWNTSKFIHQEPEDFKSCMLSPVAIKPNFFTQEGSAVTVNEETQVRYHTQTIPPWQNFLGDMHRESGITLIAESVQFDKCTFYTEKTVYSVLACNFPLWIGGYAQADMWEKMGFDTFGDVIDHSYQYEESLFDRIYLAFKLNLDLLKDYDKIKELRELNMPRLLDNRQLLFDGQIEKYNNNVLESLDSESRQIIVTLINKLFK